jgi:CheY-like chemotaxis protein
MEKVHSSYWLVVEDDDNDFLLFERACLRVTSSRVALRRSDSGLAAKAYLSGGNPLPSLIVSDIKMPGMDGFELLEWVKGQPKFGCIPFVMVSNSNSASDVLKARMLGADDFQVKPSDSRSLTAVVEGLAAQCRD